MRRSLLQALALATAALIPGLCGASVVTVPDDYATIQAAIDTGVDTVLVREGDYPVILQAYRGVAILGLGSRRPRISGLAISNPFAWLSRRWTVAGIDVSGPVTLTTSNWQARNLELQFLDCRLLGGLQHDIATSTDPYDISDLLIARCHLGASSVVRAAVAVMEADTVDGQITLHPDDAFRASGCWFRGGQGTALYVEGDANWGMVDNNLIESYANGVVVAYSYKLTLRSNVIRGMSGYALRVWGDGGVVSNNAISDCGQGIQTDFFDASISDNSWLRILGTAIWLDQPLKVKAERNVIDSCGEYGIVVEWGDYGDFQFAKNTFSRSRSGVVIYGAVNNVVVFDGNIFYRNREWGLEVNEPQASVALQCNDWFGNNKGAAKGVQLGAHDLEADPGFCDAANQNFQVYSDSPLLSEVQCDQIGALGIGCSPPSLKALSVASTQTGLWVAWEFQSALAVESWVERADEAAGPWDSLGTGAPGVNDSREVLDATVAPDRAYHYRVAWKDRGAVVRGAPVTGIWVDAGRLSSVSPNPASNNVKVEWVLAQPGRTDIRIFDLAGREVAVVAKGTYGVGRHQAQWDGHTESQRRAPAGMYIVRITSPDRTTSHRVLLVR